MSLGRARAFCALFSRFDRDFPFSKNNIDSGCWLVSSSNTSCRSEIIDARTGAEEMALSFWPIRSSLWEIILAWSTSMQSFLGDTFLGIMSQYACFRFPAMIDSSRWWSLFVPFSQKKSKQNKNVHIAHENYISHATQTTLKLVQFWVSSVGKGPGIILYYSVKKTI